MWLKLTHNGRTIKFKGTKQLDCGCVTWQVNRRAAHRIADLYGVDNFPKAGQVVSLHGGEGSTLANNRTHFVLWPIGQVFAHDLVDAA